MGPYSQATKLGDFVYLSGQVALDPDRRARRREHRGTDPSGHEEHRVILSNLGLRYDHIMKTTVFLKDLNDFQAFNDIRFYFDDQCPARSCIAVADIPAGSKVEVECLVIDTLVYEQQMAAQQSGCLPAAAAVRARLRRLLRADRKMKKTGAGEAPVCVMWRWSNRRDRSLPICGSDDRHAVLRWPWHPDRCRSSDSFASSPCPF
ncbi:MAG: Rid family hydrolase [Merdibacter sp.]